VALYGGGLMAISFRGATSVSTGNGSNGGNNIILTKPTGVVAGDVMYAFFNSHGLTAQVHVTCTGWTEVVVDVDGPDTGSIMVMRRVADGTEGSTFTFNDGGHLSLRAGGIAAYIGVDNVTPEDATPTKRLDITFTSPWTSPSITTVTPNAWWVVVFMNSPGGTPSTLTLPSGFTADIGLWSFGAGWDCQRVDHKSIASPGATGTSSSTPNAVGDYFAISLALRAALTPGNFLLFF
jgi:hypothetical protein